MRPLLTLPQLATPLTFHSWLECSAKGPDFTWGKTLQWKIISHKEPERKKNLKQDWLLAFWNKIQAHNRKNAYLLRQIYNLKFFGVIPFDKDGLFIMTQTHNLQIFRVIPFDKDYKDHKDPGCQSVQAASANQNVTDNVFCMKSLKCGRHI